MLEQVLIYLNNWFLMPDGIHEDSYSIQDGGIALPFLRRGQYFRIMGSLFNDGLHRYQGSDDLIDEAFHGVVWALAVPKAVVSLAEEIAAWQAKNGEIAASPYTAESFGGYSYTKSANGNDGGVLTWQGVFANRLRAWRKPREVGYVKPARHNLPPFYPPYNPDYPWR